MSRNCTNLLVVLGPTASGKTRLGVALARAFGGEVVSADSRQVYRGLNLTAGKDLEEYRTEGKPVAYHLIDIVDLDHEFSVFEYQRRFFDVHGDLTARGVLPVLVGGTGLYLEAVLKGYGMVEVPRDDALRRDLAGLPHDALIDRLRTLKPVLHNTTDLVDRERLVRAIEIATFSQDHDAEPTPEIRPVILGTRWQRAVLRDRIRERLVQRIGAGMIEEVEGLVEAGISWEKLHSLGLEFRYIARFLQGDLETQDELVDKLGGAIYQFARRQESWFRRMERHGTTIHWIDNAGDQAALRTVREHVRR
jgi:tRNA dimethylallyltransferase